MQNIFIHIHSKRGLYTVDKYDSQNIYLSTKHSKFTVPVADFKCFAGGSHNWHCEEEMKTFFKTACPAKYQEQLEKEREILARLKEEEEEQLYQEQCYADAYEPTKEDFEEWWIKTTAEVDKLKKEAINNYRKIYKNLAELPILKNLQIEEGVKFIIQLNENDEYRFCFDPYKFMSNYHSNISVMYDNDNERDLYYTVSGGWMKIIGNTLILYGKSGDYGVYNDEIAVKCARKLFPTLEIVSHAGLTWENIQKPT